MNGKTKSIVENLAFYKCLVSTTENSKVHIYIGVAEGDWKQHYCNNTKLFKNDRHKNDKALSIFLWKCKKSKKEVSKM